MASTSSDKKQRDQDEADRLARLETWIARGLGEYPFIDSKEAYEALPDTGKAELTARFPEHVEYLTANSDLLPAELRLRMEKKQLLFTDQAALERAGYVAAVAHLSKAQQKYMLEAWEASSEQGRQDAEANAKAREEVWAKAQAEGLERSNARFRQEYIRKLQSGSSVEQTATAVAVEG